MKTILLAILLSANLCYALVFKPDPTKTPGSFCSTSDKDFLEYRYSEGIVVCDRNVTSGVKTSVYNSYGVPQSERTEYTIDHKIPLFMGGINRVDNLWPQPKVVSTTKLEGQIYTLLKDGVLKQEQSLKLILSQKQ